MMDAITRTHYDNLSAADGTVRYEAYNAILAATEQPVDWAYEVWDELVARRSIRQSGRKHRYAGQFNKENQNDNDQSLSQP